MGRYYSSMLRSSKEEQQVPDTITMDSKSTRMNDIDRVCPIKNDDDVIDILDELESIWGVEEEDNVLVEGDGIFGDLKLNFMEEWNDDDQFPIEEHQYFKEEDIDEEFYTIKHTDRFLEEGEEESPYCNTVKREILGFENEQEKIPLNLNLNLNLNYQEVMDAWSNRGSLWAEEYSPHSMANNTFMGEVPVMEEKKTRREEKVLRYKEKRQNRLFSKKIRYQVRKLNAEKRPRLKGRFVKRVPDKIFIR